MTKNEYVIGLIFLASLFGMYTIYAPFLLAFFVALLLAMATSNLYFSFYKKFKSHNLSAVFLTLIMSLIFFAPIFYSMTSGIQYIALIDESMIKSISNKLQSYIQNYPTLNDVMKNNFGSDKIIAMLKNSTSTLSKAGGMGFGFVANIMFIIIFYFFIIRNLELILNYLKSIMPIGATQSKDVVAKISSTMEIVFYSIITTAIFQGLLFGVMVSVFGFNGLLLGVLFGFASLIPILGGSLVWIPVALYSWSEIDYNTALFIAIYSIVVISIVADTFIKPLIIKFVKNKIKNNHTQINEMIIFFSIFAGMSTFGFWGMIIGPAVTAFFVAFADIYVQSYGNRHISK